MSISYSAFFAPTVLGTSAAVLTTVPAAPATTLLRGGRVKLTNTTASAVTATLYAVPNGGSPGAGNTFLPAKPIGANDAIDVDVPIMPAGSTLQGLAGAGASITAHMLAGSLFA